MPIAQLKKTIPKNKPPAEIFIGADSHKIVVKKEQHIFMIETDQTAPVEIKIILEKGAQLTYLRLQNTEPTTNITAHRNFILHDESALTLYNLSLGAANENLDIRAEIKGSRALSNLNILSFGAHNQSFNFRIANIFEKPSSSGLIKIKSIADQNSAAKIDGMIIIEQTAPKTDAALEESALLLGKKARIQNIPALEIKTNDVKARHSAAVSRLNEEELFYLASRGIDEKTARNMIIQGFLNEIIAAIPHVGFAKMAAAALTCHCERSEAIPSLSRLTAGLLRPVPALSKANGASQ